MRMHQLKNNMSVLPLIMATLTFFVLNTNSNIAQQTAVHQYIELDTILYFKDENNHDALSCSSWGDEILFTNFNSNSHSDTITFYLTNIKTFNTQTIKIYLAGIRKEMKQSMSNHFRDRIAFSGDKIAIMEGLGYNKGIKIILFKKDKGNSFYHHKIIHSKITPNEICFIDTSTLLLSEISYRTGASFHTIDANTGITMNSIYPFHNNKIISNFTSKQYDTKDNLLLYANRLEYSFLTFDRNLQQLDSTFQKIEGWGKLPDKAIKTIEQKWGDDFNAAEINHYLTQYYTKIHQLNRVYVINKNKLLLSYTPKDTENDIGRPIIDIWEKNDFGWIRSKHDIVDDLGFNRSDSIIKTNSFFLEMLSNPQIFVFNNKIVTVSDEGTPIYPIGMTPRDYYAKSNDYLAENEQIIEIRIFSHNF